MWYRGRQEGEEGLDSCCVIWAHFGQSGEGLAKLLVGAGQCGDVVVLAHIQRAGELSGHRRQRPPKANVKPPDPLQLDVELGLDRARLALRLWAGGWIQRFMGPWAELAYVYHFLLLGWPTLRRAPLLWLHNAPQYGHGLMAPVAPIVP